MSNVRDVARTGVITAQCQLRAVFICCPWAHPFWHTYLVTIVHLRPVEELPPPNLAYPDASHEIMIQAMDPSVDLGTESPASVPPKSALQPPNLAHQLRGQTDAQARVLFDAFVQAIAKRELSPDTDHRRSQLAWFERWGRAS
jgi:hypothetical protein